MKKLLYFLFILPLAFFASCNSDDDLAQVDLTITLDGVTMLNGNFYTISGNDITIQDLTVEALNGKNAAITNVTFYFEGRPILGSGFYPSRGTFSTSGLTDGTYYLGLTGLALEVDKTVTTVSCSFPLTIVENKEDLPSEAPEIGSYSSTIRLATSN